MSKITQVSTQEIVKQLNNPKVKFIDVRTVDAYNGWSLSDEKRSGHIATAKSIPFKWIAYLDWPDIIHAKGIVPQDKLIVYGYNSDEIEKVAFQFVTAGYSDVCVYHKFLPEWCPDEKLPMARLERYHQLVSAPWLKTLLETGVAPHYTNRNFVLGHTYYHDKNIYEKGHIPGAIGIDTNTLESPNTWNRRSPEELKSGLEKLGITCSTSVILYGSFSEFDADDPFPGRNAGHIAAMRCAFIMLYAGVKDVRILNGGMQAWIDEGYRVSTETTVNKPVTDFGVRIPQHPELAVDIPEAKQILHSKDKNLVCVRSWKEYIGETSGYNYIAKKGRIPGAVFANCGSDAYHMENYRNVDYTTREYHEIDTLWAQAGITPQKHNAFYCGTGWRASEAFINAWLMGWPRISVFDGGWFEWSNDDTNPFETGIPDSN